MSDVKSWIDERRAIIREARESIRPADAVELGLLDLPRALNALQNVIDLHAPDEAGWCGECEDLHPCPTRLLIRKAIDHE